MSDRFRWWEWCMLASLPLRLGAWVMFPVLPVSSGIWGILSIALGTLGAILFLLSATASMVHRRGLRWRWWNTAGAAVGVALALSLGAGLFSSPQTMVTMGDLDPRGTFTMMNTGMPRRYQYIDPVPGWQSGLRFAWAALLGAGASGALGRVAGKA